MKRIDDREGILGSHYPDAQAPGAEPRGAAAMMVDAIMEELTEMNIDLESISLDDMKRLFSDACRDA